MAKFPDPTRDYKAKPIASPIDLSAVPDPTLPSPPTETDITPQSQATNAADTTNTQSPPEESFVPTLDTSSTSEPPIALTPDEISPNSTPAPEPTIDSTSPSSPPNTASAPSPNPINPPSIHRSPFKNLVPLLLVGGIFLILALVGFVLLPRLFSPKTPTITLTYWGLWEPSSVMQTVIADYEAKNPNIKIVYTMQSPKNYRARLQTAIEQGTAPDIARIHNTWLPVLRKHLAPAPESVVPASILEDYYPVVKKDFYLNNKLYALPLMIDGLALYYNEDILKKASATPPSDWNSLRKLAYDLTIKNKVTNVIEQAGVALGTTNNIDHWSDILGLLILQNSGNPGKPDTQAVQDAITFYTTFSAVDKTWDATQPNDIYAFATGTVAMILAPSWQAATIAAINPDLNFKVVPAPTLPEVKTAWATYWAEAVPISSKNQLEAWKFIRYLSNPEVLQKLYSAQTQIRKIGEIYPRVDMASLLSTDPIAGAFVNQAQNYTSWYLSRKTYDEAINDELIKYYEDALNPVIDGSPLASVLKTLSSGVAQVLTKYPEAK